MRVVLVMGVGDHDNLVAVVMVVMVEMTLIEWWGGGVLGRVVMVMVMVLVLVVV